MSELICRAEESRRLAGDPSLPRWKRLHEALAVFSGLRLDLLTDGAKEEIETAFGSINRILAKYPLEEAEDYRTLSDADMDAAFGIIDLAAARLIDLELDRIVGELDQCAGVLPVAAIQEAREHRDLMVPRLVKVLTEKIAKARQGELPDGDAHFFAIFLLSEFDAKDAFPVILEAFSLPGDLPFALFDDAVEATWPRILAQFADDGADLADSLIRNPDLDEIVRWACAQAFVHFVRDGKITREEAVERLRQHLTWAMAEEDAVMVGGLICVLADFAAKEAVDDMKEAFDRELVDPLLINYKRVEENVAEGERHFGKILEQCPETGISDTIEELRKWAYFAEKPREKPLPPPIPAQPHFDMPLQPSKPLSRQAKKTSSRVGRNDPCPCGSGKKFKKCCMSRSQRH